MKRSRGGRDQGDWINRGSKGYEYIRAGGYREEVS